MSMEQRITTLEEVTERVLAALRGYDQAMRRYYAASALRDEAMLQAANAIQQLEVTTQQLQATTQQLQATTQQLQATMGRLQEASREEAEALEHQDEAIRALLGFVPVTQAEIVRLDSRIDNIEGA